MRRLAISAGLTAVAAVIAVVALLDADDRTGVAVTRPQNLRSAPVGLDVGDLLDRAWAAASEPISGRVTVVALEGPAVFELAVTTTPDGTRVVGEETWFVSQDADSALIWTGEGARSLQRASALPRVPGLRAMSRKYDLAIVGVRELDTGPAVLVAVREHEAVQDREWLSLDLGTGMLVRRESFAGDGTPERLVAYTDVSPAVGEVTMPDVNVRVHTDGGRTLSADGREILAEIGWVVPPELPGGFVLDEATALAAAEGSAVHLAYADGLYRLSLYEQPGTVDPSGLQGAVAESHEGMRLYRWPGAQPLRLVWTGDDRTFTVVTDAPLDAIMPALHELPNDPAPGVLRRLGRGLLRVTDAIWPF